MTFPSESSDGAHDESKPQERGATIAATQNSGSPHSADTGSGRDRYRSSFKTCLQLTLTREVPHEVLAE